MSCPETQHIVSFQLYHWTSCGRFTVAILRLGLELFSYSDSWLRMVCVGKALLVQHTSKNWVGLVCKLDCNNKRTREVIKVQTFKWMGMLKNRPPEIRWTYHAGWICNEILRLLEETLTSSVDVDGLQLAQQFQNFSSQTVEKSSLKNIKNPALTSNWKRLGFNLACE